MSYSLNQAKIGVVIPAFVSATNAMFNTIITQKQTHPNVPMAVILDVTQGPGPNAIPEYTNVIASLNNNTIITLGFVATDFGQIPEATVKADIDKWKSFYPTLKGIFFANMSNQSTMRTYYNNLNVYAKQTKGFITTMGGAGIKVDNNFLNGFCADTIIVYEGLGKPQPSNYSSYDSLPNSNIALTPYACSALDSTWIQQIAAYAGWVYMTNDSTPNPFDTLPPYFANLMTTVDGIGSGTATGNRNDNFGIRKVYETKQGGEEWYVNRADWISDTRLQNEPALTKNADGSYSFRGSSPDYQVRIEAWSPAYADSQQRINAKWFQVEITGYQKVNQELVEAPYLAQWYSRGGHHGQADHCEGSALKNRIYRRRRSEDTTGLATAFVKEICHSSYCDNQGIVSNVVPWSSTSFFNRWIGIKHVIYNIKRTVSGTEKTFTRQETYLDVNVNNPDGTLHIQNDWKFIGAYEDRGGWFSSQSTYDSDCTGCDRARDAILTEPGGCTTSSSANFNRNLAAWRWDGLDVRADYLTVREIDPEKFVLDDVLPPPPVEPGSAFDIFGVRKIYSTKSGGAEWFISSNPAQDTRFNSNVTLNKNADGTSFNISTSLSQILLNIYQPVDGYNASTTSAAAKSHSTCAANGYMQSFNDWRNVEMSGYIRINSSQANVSSDLCWFARGGRHLDPSPNCEGSSMKAFLRIDGQSQFAKEQWHQAYFYTTPNNLISESLLNKWIGFKAVVYNKNVGGGQKIVKQEIFVDMNNDNTWVKIDENADTGGWGDRDGTCGGASPDQLITWGAPIVTLRMDGINNVDITKLSVREIDEQQGGGSVPGQNPSSCGS